MEIKSNTRQKKKNARSFKIKSIQNVSGSSHCAIGQDRAQRDHLRRVLQEQARGAQERQLPDRPSAGERQRLRQRNQKGVPRRRRHRAGLPLRRGVQQGLHHPQAHGPLHPVRLVQRGDRRNQELLQRGSVLVAGGQGLAAEAVRREPHPVRFQLAPPDVRPKRRRLRSEHRPEGVQAVPGGQDQAAVGLNMGPRGCGRGHAEDARPQERRQDHLGSESRAETQAGHSRQGQGQEEAVL